MSAELKDVAVVVATVAIPFFLALLTATRFLFRGAEVKRRLVKGLFSATFALSVDTLILAIFEIADVLDPGIRWLTWRIVLGALIVTLVVILPVTFVLVTAADLGIPKRAARVLAFFAEIAFLWTFWWLGAFFPIVEQGENGLFSFEGSIGRLGVAGVAAAAILSGYGAIATLFASWSAWNMPPVMDSELRVKRETVRSAVARLLRQQQYEAELEWRRSIALSGGGVGGGMTTPSRGSNGTTPTSLGGEGEVGSSPGRDFGGSSSPVSSWSLMDAAVSVLEFFGVPLDSPPTPGGSGGVGGGAGSGSAAGGRKGAYQGSGIGLNGVIDLSEIEAELKSERGKVRIAKDIEREAFLDYVQLLSTRRQQEWAVTLRGRVLIILGYVLSGFALYKLMTALYNVVLSGGPTRSAAKDPVTNGIEVALRFLKVSPEEAALWVQPVSFIFIGTLVFTSVRGFLLNFSQAFAFSRSLGRSLGLSTVTSSSVILLLAQVMGMYFVSVLLLMRMSMPEQYRSGVTKAIGSIDFKFFHRWFDFIFVLSAVASFVAFGMLFFAHSSSRGDKGGLDASSSGSGFGVSGGGRRQRGSAQPRKDSFGGDGGFSSTLARGRGRDERGGGGGGGGGGEETTATAPRRGPASPSPSPLSDGSPSVRLLQRDRSIGAGSLGMGGGAGGGGGGIRSFESFSQAAPAFTGASLSASLSLSAAGSGAGIGSGRTSTAVAPSAPAVVSSMNASAIAGGDRAAREEAQRRLLFGGAATGVSPGAAPSAPLPIPPPAVNRAPIAAMGFALANASTPNSALTSPPQATGGAFVGRPPAPFPSARGGMQTAGIGPRAGRYRPPAASFSSTEGEGVSPGVGSRGFFGSVGGSGGSGGAGGGRLAASPPAPSLQGTAGIPLQGIPAVL